MKRLNHFFCLVCGIALSLPAFAATQQIVLESGWNLISFQIGDADLPIADFEASIDTPGALVAVWGYDAIKGKWLNYQAVSEKRFLSDLATVRPGVGYWVKVNEPCVVTLEGNPWEGGLALQPGWNLVGFPGLGTTDLKSIFQNAFASVKQVWGFEGGAMGRFVGYDITAVPQRKDLASVSCGRGYWVYASNEIALLAEPEIMLTGDFDLPPLQPKVAYAGANPVFAKRLVKMCGAEDAATDLNGNGIVDDAWTQDTILFDVGVERQPIVIGNTSGSGALNWSVDTDCDWLSIEGESSGTIAASKAYVYLVAHRENLDAGVYSNAAVTVTAGGMKKQITVVLKVATVAGDFKGYASATKVNNKDVSLGKVDMGLNIFMETEKDDETRFKAVVDKESSLLFPRDVFMNGVFYVGNCFSLTTSFSMPASDRNAPPFDTFEHVDPELDQEGFGDKDWNKNGVLDVDNPFPFPIRRSITLLGQRTDENTLEGSYLETIAGALPKDEKIVVEGTFSLSRSSFKPTRKSIYNEKNDEISLIGQSKSTSIDRVITLSDAVHVQTVTVSLNVEFPVPEALTITLTSPEGTTVALHNRGSSLAAATTLSDFDGENGRGDWTLHVEWLADSGERGWFYSFGLDVGGLATYQVAGRLVDENGNPLAGASVSLSGSNEIGAQTTDENGNFTLDGLTENDYSIIVSVPGYQSATKEFIIDSDNVTLGDVQATSWGKLGLTGIMATPAVGYAPLDVQFVAGYTPTNDAAVTSVVWCIERVDAAGETSVSKVVSPIREGMNSWSTVQSFDESVYSYRAIVDIAMTDDGTVERKAEKCLTLKSLDDYRQNVDTEAMQMDCLVTGSIFGADPGQGRYVAQNYYNSPIAGVSGCGTVPVEYACELDLTGRATYGVMVTKMAGKTSAYRLYVTYDGEEHEVEVPVDDELDATSWCLALKFTAQTSVTGLRAVFTTDRPAQGLCIPAVQLERIPDPNDSVCRFVYGPVALAHTGLSSSSDPTHPLTAYLSQCGFIGAGAGVSEYDQMKRDCAAFDIDRWPVDPSRFSTQREDTDFFVQQNTPYYRIDREPLDSYYDEYEQPESGANRFRMITTMGGCVFGESPAQVGGFMLQTGRIED